MRAFSELGPFFKISQGANCVLLLLLLQPRHRLISAIALGVERVRFERFRRKYPRLTRNNFVGVIPQDSPDYDEMNDARLFIDQVHSERER